MNIAVLSFDQPDSACARYRIFTPLDDGEGRVSVSWAVLETDQGPAINGEALQEADIFIVQRFFPQPFTLPVLDACFASGKPVIYETDDMMADLPEGNVHAPTAKATMDVLNKMGDRFTLITTSTPELAAHLKLLNPKVAVVPNRLDPLLWPGRPAVHGEPPIRILYAGTETHMQDLALIEDALLETLDKNEGAVEAALFGCATRRLEEHAAVEVIPPVNDYAEYTRMMNGADFDIALAPLADNPFNRVKSHVKWLEYSACGMAGIYSALPPYDCVRHGETGLLASTPEEWTQCLHELIATPELRTRIARQSWSEIETNHLAAGADGELITICYRLTSR